MSVVRGSHGSAYDWWAARPGRLITACHIVLEPAEGPEPDADQLARAFEGQRLLGSLVALAAFPVYLAMRGAPSSRACWRKAANVASRLHSTSGFGVRPARCSSTRSARGSPPIPT